MFGLTNKTDVPLKWLFINDVKIKSYDGLRPVGYVYKGEYKGQQVALKVLDKEVCFVIFSLSHSRHYYLKGYALERISSESSSVAIART